VLGDLTVEEAAGLGAGVIAAIVISAVVIAVIAAIGGKKGYDVYVRNRNMDNVAGNNPLYQDQQKTGASPFYNKNSFINFMKRVK